MMYLIDSNCLIEAYRRYYSFDIVPTFWEKFLITYQHSIFLIDKVRDELCSKSNKHKDDLQLWVEDNCCFKGKVILSNQQKYVDKYAEILQFIYDAPQYKTSSFIEWSNNLNKADPWLIAVASIDKFTIVTMEKSDPNLSAGSPTKREPKIPDVCKWFDVECIDLFELMRRENCIV